MRPPIHLELAPSKNGIKPDDPPQDVDKSHLSDSTSTTITFDRIPSTTPGAEPPRGAKDSGSARSHSTHLETSSQKRP